jgi:hypothetical protein
MEPDADVYNVIRRYTMLNRASGHIRCVHPDGTGQMPDEAAGQKLKPQLYNPGEIGVGKRFFYALGSKGLQFPNAQAMDWVANEIPLIDRKLMDDFVYKPLGTQFSWVDKLGGLTGTFSKGELKGKPILAKDKGVHCPTPSRLCQAVSVNDFETGDTSTIAGPSISAAVPPLPPVTALSHPDETDEAFESDDEKGSVTMNNTSRHGFTSRPVTTDGFESGVDDVSDDEPSMSVDGFNNTKGRVTDTVDTTQNDDDQELSGTFDTNSPSISELNEIRDEVLISLQPTFNHQAEELYRPEFDLSDSIDLVRTRNTKAKHLRRDSDNSQTATPQLSATAGSTPLEWSSDEEEIQEPLYQVVTVISTYDVADIRNLNQDVLNVKTQSGLSRPEILQPESSHTMAPTFPNSTRHEGDHLRLAAKSTVPLADSNEMVRSQELVPFVVDPECILHLTSGGNPTIFDLKILPLPASPSSLPSPIPPLSPPSSLPPSSPSPQPSHDKELSPSKDIDMLLNAEVSPIQTICNQLSRFLKWATQVTALRS